MTIISHKRKFIFVKTAKTAGTSLEIALSKFCGSEDIITPISTIDEETRSKLGYRGPQNYLPSGFRKHMPANKIKELIGDTIWNTYYKFCFERNPWDRLISFYYWTCKLEPRPSIAEFLKLNPNCLNYLRNKGYYLYANTDGRLLVDRVCLYENLNEEIRQLKIQLELAEDLDLPKAKAYFRKDKRSYRKILNESQRKQIEEVFSKEISLFGYEF